MWFQPKPTRSVRAWQGRVARAGARVCRYHAFSDDGDLCILHFTAEAGASNTIMKLGKALIGGAAQHVIDGFFERFAEAMQVSLEVLPQDPDTEISPEGDAG